MHPKFILPFGFDENVLWIFYSNHSKINKTSNKQTWFLEVQLCLVFSSNTVSLSPPVVPTFLFQTISPNSVNKFDIHQTLAISTFYINEVNINRIILFSQSTSIASSLSLWQPNPSHIHSKPLLFHL